MVCNAVVEMRRYYSRKVIDVLIKVIRAALDTIRRRFIADDDETTLKKPVFALYAQLQIPSVVIKPNLEELQEILITAGRNITGIAKGVAQWTSGKENPVSLVLLYEKFPLKLFDLSLASIHNTPTSCGT